METGVTKWEDIRIMWSNGEQPQTRSALLAVSKIQMMCIILEALRNYHKSFNSTTRTHSGDLIDLIEVLNYSRI